jgi:predicted transcriptional regulator
LEVSLVASLFFFVQFFIAVNILIAIAKMGSSQSRIAKIESGDPSVSLDLIVRALLTSGATRQELAQVIMS